MAGFIIQANAKTFLNALDSLLMRLEDEQDVALVLEFFTPSHATVQGWTTCADCGALVVPDACCCCEASRATRQAA